ncbi:hypothetical protein ACQKIE_06425 [Luteibacter sp. NPDC031894]|uniref:hypothetical protein n=1 Tax=Luteibacter sp. NPDC031894 TaxID=3390572 RepID=UPI003CFEF74C
MKADESPSLFISQKDGAVYVVLSNLGNQSIKVRRDYLLDRLFGNLLFDIRRKGKTFPETAHINPEMPTESTYLVLAPGQIGGHVVDQWLIKAAYSLSSGCYTVSAVYRDSMAKDFSAFDGELRSNSIELCFKDANM